MRIPIDPHDVKPIYRQVHDFLSEQIRSGTLEPGTRLPATRDLAKGLGVNRITISNAYADLESEGLVYSRQGSGTYVSPPLREEAGHLPKAQAISTWPLWQQQMMRRQRIAPESMLDRMLGEAKTDDLISLASGHAAPDLLPVDDLRRAVADTLRRDGVDALMYGDRAGYAPLRERIAHRLAEQGVPAHPDEILITSGSQQALSTVAGALLRPGDAVLVESPTYSGALDLFRSLEVLLVGVPVDNEGMRVDVAEELARVHRPRLIYTVPTFHNPTGSCMSGLRRRQLLALAEKHDIPILEDDFASELRYDSHDVPAIKALDRGGRVIYVSTFSKSLAPGIRVGYLVAPGPVYEHLLACKRVEDLAGSNLIQRALENYMSSGAFTRHLKAVRREYRERRDTLEEALRAEMTEEVTWLSPQGGLFLWLSLPTDISDRLLFQEAARQGMAFAPGFVFFLSDKETHNVRLNFAASTPQQIREAVHRLAAGMARVDDRAQVSFETKTTRVRPVLV